MSGLPQLRLFWTSVFKSRGFFCSVKVKTGSNWNVSGMIRGIRSHRADDEIDPSVRLPAFIRSPFIPAHSAETLASLPLAERDAE